MPRQRSRDSIIVGISWEVLGRTFLEKTVSERGSNNTFTDEWESHCALFSLIIHFPIIKESLKLVSHDLGSLSLSYFNRITMFACVKGVYVHLWAWVKMASTFCFIYLYTLQPWVGKSRAKKGQWTGEADSRTDGGGGGGNLKPILMLRVEIISDVSR